jgi:DNA repair protein RecN (Recombination protein N)
MLTQIDINNLITIEKLHLELSSGTTVITGESGVGKSIIIDAIELALGGRATGDIVRPGQEKADISLSFDLTHLPEAIAWLKEYDLNTDSSECLIRRTLYRDGRSRSYINQMPTTLQPLRELSELLINIHGQHEHQTLLKADTQRMLLDRYANHEQLVDKIKYLATEWHTCKRDMVELTSRAEERSTRAEFLKFQLHELEELHLSPNEFETLDIQHKQLAHAETLLQNLQQATLFLSEQEGQNTIALLNNTIRALENIKNVDPKIISWVGTLNNALVQLSDVENELYRYHEAIEIDPEQLQKTEQRLSILFNLARKHKIDPPELYNFQQQVNQELQDLDQSDERIELLIKKMQELEKNYLISAEQLSKSRAQAAKKLAKEITNTMQSLSLPTGQFQVYFEPIEKNQLPLYGLEKIIFQIQTCPDHPLLPLAKIASGGELSRISLAIHIATAKKQTTPTLIFDEVDVGISGHTAEMIGKLLRQLGETLQVFCVTHSPQVAAQGNHHLNVKKMVTRNTTYTAIDTLSFQDKVSEIARMLGGIEITDKTIAHATEMLEKTS